MSSQTEVEKPLENRGHPKKTVETKDAANKKTKGVAATNEEEVDPTKYFQNRKAAMEARREEGQEVYPHKWNTTFQLGEFIKKYEHLTDGEHLESDVVKVAGRLMRLAGSGAKLRFYDLCSDNVKVQIMASAGNHDSAIYGSFEGLHNMLRRGDIVGVEGFPGRSKRGELSIFPRGIKLLSPCYHMLPSPYTGIKDLELRYRRRYLDLIVNPAVKRTFHIRSQIIRFIRRFLEDRNFVEVETPMMHAIQGGAAARPFVTYHNELDAKLFMRIAPELYLKMLTVGGMDRVYEIGKNFRNEGIDLTHNPEFTSCEFYMAYGDYFDLMNMTETMVSKMVYEIHGSYKVKYHTDGHDGEEKEIDFTPPYPRISFVAEIEKCAGVSIPRPLNSPEAIEAMKSLCKREGLDFPKPCIPSKLLDRLCGHFVESKIVSPAFIADHPQIMSPLAKWHRDLPEMTERCELFVLGQEIANFYTELNDPFRQRDLFMAQMENVKAGDDEAQPVDENFCTALEYGLPPTAGWGLGIDRLTMLLSDKNNIKEVILFPAMRPEREETQAKSPEREETQAKSPPSTQEKMTTTWST